MGRTGRCYTLLRKLQACMYTCTCVVLVYLKMDCIFVFALARPANRISEYQNIRASEHSMHWQQRENRKGRHSNGRRLMATIFIGHGIAPYKSDVWVWKRDGRDKRDRRITLTPGKQDVVEIGLRKEKKKGRRIKGEDKGKRSGNERKKKKK